MSKIITDTSSNSTSGSVGLGAPAMLQATVIPTVSGASTAATVVIETTNDFLIWSPLVTFNLSGTGIQTSAQFIDAPWDSVRAVVSGLGADNRVLVSFNTMTGRL